MSRLHSQGSPDKKATPKCVWQTFNSESPFRRAHFGRFSLFDHISPQKRPWNIVFCHLFTSFWGLQIETGVLWGADSRHPNKKDDPISPLWGCTFKEDSKTSLSITVGFWKRPKLVCWLSCFSYCCSLHMYCFFFQAGASFHEPHLQCSHNWDWTLTHQYGTATMPWQVVS